MHRNELFEGNFFLGHTLSGGCPATNDATLGTRDQTLKNNWWSSYTAGYHAAGCDSVTIDGNFMFRPMHSDATSTSRTAPPIYFAQRRGKDTNPCRPGVTFTNNTYWGNPRPVEGKKAASERARHHQRIRAEWYAGERATSTCRTTKPPDRNYTAVRKNAYRPGSCNVYVANFLDAAAVPVDLSTCGLADGARFEIRSIYNYMGAPVGTGTYAAASPNVDFPMTPAANPIANSVGHLEGGAPGSYPDMHHSLTRPGGNIFRNAFVVLTPGRRRRRAATSESVLVDGVRQLVDVIGAPGEMRRQLVSHGPHGLDDALGELALAEVVFHRRGHGGPEIRARLLVDRDVAEDAKLVGTRRDVDEHPVALGGLRHPEQVKTAEGSLLQVLRYAAGHVDADLGGSLGLGGRDGLDDAVRIEF